MEPRPSFSDHYDKEFLLMLVEDLQGRLDRKNKQIAKMRLQLSVARQKVNSMKETVSYQRKRILELRS